MKKHTKKAIRLLGAICISSLLAAGCSSTPASETTGGQDVNLQSSASDNIEPSKTDTTQGGSIADASEAEILQNDTSTDNTEGKWHVLSPEVAAAVDADFEGCVWKIDDKSFYIVPSETEILDGGILLSGSPSTDADIPDSELVSVVFDESTHFYIRTIYNGGESYEDSDAAFQDIKKDQSVSLKGSFENDIFHATEIRISKVS
ncbi:MAG: hypothetical protein K2K74_14830 [Lachnospiraceae bacterium]|nr:hypothetical protein [Lachnospiraceae bacterium]